MLYKPTFKKSVPESATISRKRGKQYATWTGRNGRKISVEIRTRDKEKYVLIPTATWYARYVDSQGRHIQRNTGCSDKSAAQGVLTEWRGTAEKVKAGFLRAADEHKDRRNGPITVDQACKQYVQSLQSAGRTEKHRDHVERVVKAAAAHGNINRLIDFTRVQVERYLAHLQDAGLSARTRNHHKTILSGFGKYCVRHGHLEANPAAYIESANQAVDRRKIRRALTDDEITKLLDAAEKRPLENFLGCNTGKVEKIKPATIEKYRTMGQERRLIYETLLTTAARWGELRAVTVSDCVLDSKAPYIRLKATATKNRHADTVPLTRDLAGKLKRWVRDTGRIGKAPLFDMAVNAAKRFNSDIEYAGLDKNTDDGVIDVHALRHTAATRLARAGVPVSVAQRILRHSDPKLTMSLYSHLGVLDTTAAVESLPALTGKKAKTRTKKSAS